MKRHRSWYVAALAAGAALALLGAKCSLFNKAPAVPAVTGPAQGVAGVPVTFKATATDPDGDSIAFQFDWGDTTTPAWSAFLASGETLSAAHTYADSGNYTVKARAKDRGGKESGWSVEQALQLVGSGPGYPDSILCELWMPWEVSGSALSPDGATLCIGPYRGSDSLVFIRTGDLTELPRVCVGAEVVAITFALDNSHVFAYSNGANRLLRVDVARGVIEGSVATPYNPQYVIAARDGAHILVDGGAMVLKLMGDDLSVVDTVQLPGRASDAVLSADGATLYVCSQQGLAVVDVASFSLTSFIDVTRDMWTAALSPRDSVLYASSGIDSGIVAIRVSDMAVIGRVNLHTPGVGEMKVAPDGRTLFVAVPAGIGYVATRTLTVVGSLGIEMWGDILVHPGGETLYYVTSRRVSVVGTSE